MTQKPIILGSIIRYRSGDSALMRVDKIDDLCGYKTFHGTHIFGEWLSVPAEKCYIASKEDRALFKDYSPNRNFEMKSVSKG